MSNGNAAAALFLTVAALTGMSHVHGAWPRSHSTGRHWSSSDERPERPERPERLDRVAHPEHAELGDVRIPVRAVRRRQPPGEERNLVFRRQAQPAVIVGYVDPARRSAAFHRLTNVVEGDRVKVVRRDHRVDWYRVDSVREAVRRNIERERSSTGRPELRLISWQGARSPRNVVVSAHLDRPAGALQTDAPASVNRP